MKEQFGGIYWQFPANISKPINDTYVRLFRDLTPGPNFGLYFIKKFDGTIEPFTGGGSGSMHFQGGVDLSGGLFPTVGGSGPTGSIAQGDTFIVTVPGSVCSTNMVVGDLIIAKTATPGQTCGNWVLVETAGSYVPYTGANATVDLNTQSLLAGKFTLGINPGNSILELKNSNTGKQLSIQADVAGFENFVLQLGTTGSLTEFHFSAPAWLVDKDQRFDTAGVANIYTNNGAQGIQLNGDNDVSGNKGIKVGGDGNLSLAIGATGVATLVGGTIVVPTNKITANSIVVLSVVNALGVGVAVGIPYEDEASRVAGTSFVINSNDLLGNLVATDVRRIRWEILETR